MSTSYNFSIDQGCDVPMLGTVTDGEGDAVDITNADIIFLAAKTLGAAELDLEVEGTVTDGEAGEYSVDLVPEDTADLYGAYHYEVQAVIGDKKYIPIKGIMSVVRSLQSE